MENQQEIDNLTGFLYEENGIIHYRWAGQEYAYRGTKENFTGYMMRFIESKTQRRISKLSQLREQENN